MQALWQTTMSWLDVLDHVTTAGEAAQLKAFCETNRHDLQQKDSKRRALPLHSAGASREASTPWR